MSQVQAAAAAVMAPKVALRKRRSVRFDEKCRVRPILHIANMSEIKSDLWYSRLEMKAMKQDCRSTMRSAAQRGISYTQNRAAFRGLELFHPKMSRRRERRRIDGWDLVLQEQAKQIFNGTRDVDRLGDLFSRLNAKTSQEARERASHDTDDLLQPEKTWEMPANGLPTEKMVTGASSTIKRRTTSAPSMAPLMERTFVY